MDGQLGNGTRREVSIPTPLYYNSACIFAQLPPRHNDFKRAQGQQHLDSSVKSNDSLATDENTSENNGNIINASKSMHSENDGPNKEKIRSIVNAVGISCGYDYTVAIQPG